MSRWPWSTLGIEATDDKGAIRSAYSVKLKQLDIDTQIPEYEQLRAARDSALAQASRVMDDEDEDDFGLGSFGRDTERWEERHRDDFEFEPYPEPFSEPDPAPSHPIDERQQQAQDAWRALVQAILPNGEFSDEALWDYEFDSALQALGTVVDYAEDSEIGVRERLSYDLSELLAQGWPRSGCMVEPAAEAFEWRRLRGSLDEWPAVSFLNDRLAAMDFEARLDRPDERLHKAWIELTAPSRPYWASAWLVKRDRVETLINLIDADYPELRHRLDPQRVAKWEGETGTRTGWVVQALIAVWALSAMVGLCSEGNADAVKETTSALDPQRIELASQERDAIAAEIFGDGFVLTDIREYDTIFANQFSNMISNARYGTPVLGQMRARMHQLRKNASFEDVVAIRAVQLSWLEAAQTKGPEACLALSGGDFSGNLPLSEAQREAERALFLRFLKDGSLSQIELVTRDRELTEEDLTFEVPGWLVERASSATGLGMERTNAALDDPSLPDRCAVDIELLKGVVERPGDVPESLLRKF